MIPPHRLALSAAIALACTPVMAVQPTLTQGGFTGLELTPTASLLDWGRFAFTYDNQLPGVTRNPAGHNFVAGFGLFPNLEVSGRVASNTMNSNCFTQGCGVRDLSASGKLGIGLDAANRFHVAAGVTDFGGHVTYFRSYYGVLTYDQGPFEASGGYARRSGAGVNGSRSPLDGPFASAAWQPLSWVRGQVEYTDRKAWAGVRLFAPQSWLPEGWSAYVGANARLTDTDLTNRTWWTAGVSIPLYKVPALPSRSAVAPLPELSGAQRPLPQYEARALPAPQPRDAVASVPVTPQAQVPLVSAPVTPQAAVPAAVPPSDDVLTALANALRDKGLEDIWVGRMADGSIAVRADNATYHWNSLDALGAALGTVARALGSQPTAYRLILAQRQIPLVGVTGQADCLRSWIDATTQTCTAGELSTPGTMSLDKLHAGAVWVVQSLQPSWKTVRLALSPVLRTHVATEVGVLDDSVGINARFTQPLWSGATLDWGIDQELARTSDFRATGVFGTQRIRNGTDLLALTQTFRLPLDRWWGHGDDVLARGWGLAAVTAQATVGRIGGHFDGALGSVRWEPGEGRHRVTVQGGAFRNSDYGLIPGEPHTAYPLLASYRYNATATRTYLEATGGQFMNNDRGLQLGVRQWFSDVSVQFYVRRTSFSTTGARNFAGVELSIPIGPRKDMNPRGLQITGTQRFSHAIETTVGGLNAIATGYGVVPPAPSLDAVHNSDRAGLLYFEDNMRRIRDAAR